MHFVNGLLAILTALKNASLTAYYSAL